MKERKYKAFISYSHKDERFGKWLHKVLEKYKIPKELREDYPYLPKSLYPLFRDREELPTSADLGVEISKALKNSEYLIIVCSVNSAKSQWVNQEIIDFKAIHGEDKVRAIILNGEPHAKENDKLDDNLECFPEALKYKVIDGKLSNEPTEPIAGDFRKGKDGKEQAKLKLIAGLLGVKFDDLNRREERRKRRNRWIWGIIGSILFVMMFGLTIFSLYQRDKAVQAEKIATEAKIRAEKNKKEAEKQLIIAKNKSQSLSILTTKTIEALILADEKILEKYLKSVLNSSEKEVFIEMLRPLIKKTESMDNEERQYWFDILPAMNEKQLSKLVKILMVESQKLYKLELKYQKEIKSLNEKYLKEWKEYIKRKCFIDNKPKICLSAIDSLLDSSLDSNESILSYFQHYEKLERNPSAYYYNLYGKYFKLKHQEKKSFNYFKKAISMESNNSDYIKSLIPFYVKDKNLTKAIQLGKEVVYFREQKLSHSHDINKTKYLKKDLLKDLKELFSLQYKEQPIKLIDELYPKYKNFIESMRDEEIGTYLYIEDYLVFSYATFKKYDKAMFFLENIMRAYSKNSNKISKSWIAGKYQSLAWYQLIIGDYQGAIKNSKKGIYLDKEQKLSLETNLAHAYLLSGNFETAKVIYMKNKMKKFKNGKLWEDVILEDFEALKKEGVKSDDFKKIEKLLYGENPIVIKRKDNKFYFYYKKSNKLCFSSNTLPSWEALQKRCPKPKDLK